MSDPQLLTIPVTTDASGDFSVVTQDISGIIHQIRYVPAASEALDTNWDLTIVGTKTGMNVLTVTNAATTATTYAPRQATHDTAGAASLYAGSGEPVEAQIFVHGESLTVTVAQGGNVQSGTIYIWVGDL